MLTPLALRVISRIRRLNRSRDFRAIVRLMSGPAVKLNPRNLRSCGRATALLASFTLSLSFCSSTGNPGRHGPERALLFDEARNALHHPLTRAFAANVDVTVVRITNKAVSAALQLAVDSSSTRLLSSGERAPRTQKVTLRSRQWRVRTAGWRAVARCHGQRDAVPDDDLVVADEDFLDEKPQDALASNTSRAPADDRSRVRNVASVSARRR